MAVSSVARPNPIADIGRPVLYVERVAPEREPSPGG